MGRKARCFSGVSGWTPRATMGQTLPKRGYAAHTSPRDRAAPSPRTQGGQYETPGRLLRTTS